VKQRLLHRLAVAWVIVAAVFAGYPRPTAAAPLVADWPIPGGHFYTQANGFPPGASPMGFALIDDNEAHFWTAFQRLGGVDRLGYPASQRFNWRGFVTQVTQKAILQWRPESGTVEFLNVFDDLSKAGKDSWLSTARSVPPPVAANFDAGLSADQVVSHRRALLTARPALASRYASTSDALDLFGLPTSPVVDEGPMYVIRLQRAVLQEWKVNEPWAKIGEVTVANGGDVGKDAGVFPERAVLPEAPPEGTAPGKPADYQLTGLATWYGPGFAGKVMANGQTYVPSDASTTAANAFPIGSTVQVTAGATGRSINVVVRDTGGFNYPRVVDLSPAAFASLGSPISTGVLTVTVQLLAFPTPTTFKTDAPPAENTVVK
jgi:hypothetical protein